MNKIRQKKLHLKITKKHFDLERFDEGVTFKCCGKGKCNRVR